MTSKYKHMTILFSKENDTNEWMILFLLKLFITQTSILRNSKKIKYKNLYLIQITETYSKTQFAHLQYYYTLTFKNKSKNDTISINCQQWTNVIDKNIENT